MVNNKSILKSILEIDKYRLKINLKKIDDAFETIKDDFNKFVIEAELLKGLWRYFLVEVLKDIEYKTTYTKGRFVETKITKKGKDTGRIIYDEILYIPTQNKWKNLDYYSSIVKIDNWVYSDIVHNRFRKWIEILLRNEKTLKHWNFTDEEKTEKSQKIEIKAFSDFGNKIVKMFTKIKPNSFVADIEKTEKDLQKQRTEKIEAINSNERISKRNKELEKKLGEIKNTIPEFINYYNKHKTDAVTTAKLFYDFKKKHDCIKNHTWRKYRITFYKYGGKLKL